MKFGDYYIGRKFIKDLFRYFDSYYIRRTDKHREFIPLLEKVRLSSYPRILPGSSKLMDHEIKFPDAYWFLYSIEELFADKVYKFSAASKTPYIIDCGSNIGLSLIYFKQNYPGCKITAFEADSNLIEISRQNFEQFGYKDITLVNKAVWVENGHIQFFNEGTLGGAIHNEDNTIKENVVKIPSIRLKDYLTVPVDFLKVDIEGAEMAVLKDCADNLKNVENLFVEFHGYTHAEQNLEDLLVTIKNAGFRYYIKESFPNLIDPFVEKIPKNNYDILLNIYCYRV